MYGGSGLWRNICKLMMKGFLLMLVLNKRQDTNAEKNVVFIVFYSLYFVYYYILKYLLFTIVAPFGKDIFFSQSAWTSTAFFFWVVVCVCVWGGGGGGKRCWGFPLVVEYRGHKKTGHNEGKQKQSEQVEERSRVILAVVSPIPDWLFFFLTTFRVGLCGWWGRGGNMKRVLGTCKF